MTNVKFRIKSDYVRKDGTCAVYAQVHMQGKTVKIPVEINIEPMFWNQAEEQVKSFHPQAEDLNMIIEQVRSNVFEVRKKYHLTNKELTPEMLKAEIRNNGGSGDFILFMNKEVDFRKQELASATYRQYKAVLSKLKSFRKELLFADLTAETLNQFQVFCRKKGNNINTVTKALKVLKVFIHIAIRRELMKQNPFDHVKLKKARPGITYLSLKERDDLLEMFKNKYTSEKHRRVLLYFLFSCFTGLRISDVKILRWENIVNDTLYITPFKTRRVNNVTVIIPLGVTAIWLIKQCKRIPRNPYVFDVISEPKTNEYLKEIADMVGIKKRLHFHVARHTFATLFYEATNDLATLQKLLGHGSITQTMVYAHVSDQQRRDQMLRFDG